MVLWQLKKKIEELMERCPNFRVYVNAESQPELLEIADIHLSETKEGEPIVEIYIDDTE